MKEPATLPLEDYRAEADRAKKHPTSFWPLLLILLALNFSTARDALNLVQHRAKVRSANIQSEKRLAETSEKAAFIDKMKGELTILAKTDPVAAQILADYFPASAAPVAATATPSRAPVSGTDLPTLAPGLAPAR